MHVSTSSQGDGVSDRTSWKYLGSIERSTVAQGAYDDETGISQFRNLVYRLRTEARMTQAELASRMGTTQSAIARMEGGGSRPTLDTLEKLARAVGQDLVVGVGVGLGNDRTIVKLVDQGHAVVRCA
jgi:DNA-binding XRE family transcriptional regulator